MKRKIDSLLRFCSIWMVVWVLLSSQFVVAFYLICVTQKKSAWNKNYFPYFIDLLTQLLNQHCILVFLPLDPLCLSIGCLVGVSVFHSYRVFIKYCVFSKDFRIFWTLVFLCFRLVSVCTHTRQIEHQRCSRTDRVQKNQKNFRKKHMIEPKNNNFYFEQVQHLKMFNTWTLKNLQVFQVF